jgi:hypothetical protein
MNRAIIHDLESTLNAMTWNDAHDLAGPYRDPYIRTRNRESALRRADGQRRSTVIQIPPRDGNVLWARYRTS